jgi:hypothetical protein
VEGRCDKCFRPSDLCTCVDTLKIAQTGADERARVRAAAEQRRAIDQLTRPVQGTSEDAQGHIANLNRASDPVLDFKAARERIARATKPNRAVLNDAQRPGVQKRFEQAVSEGDDAPDALSGKDILGGSE